MKTAIKYLAIALMLGGCATGAHRTEAAPKVPTEWTSKTAVGISPDALPASVAWWKFLNDEHLNTLVAKVAAANYDVRLAAARVREARAARNRVGTALLPSTTLNASWTATQIASEDIPSTGSPMAIGVGAGDGGLTRNFSYRGDHFSFSRSAGPNGANNTLTYTGDGPAGIDRTSQLFRLGFDSTWEIDVFGQQRAEVAAATADLKAVEFQQDAVLVSAVAEAALGYIDLRAAQRQREITEQNIAAQLHIVEITAERFRVGLSAEFDATRAQTLLDTTRAELAPIDRAITSITYRLALLAGEEPNALNDLLSTPEPLPATPSTIAIGLPSDSLRRRADIRAAEAGLFAADARIKVAVADLFPKFFLNSSFAGTDNGLLGIASSAGRVWSIGPSVKWDILKSSYIRQNIEVQNARQEQAAIGYERAAAVAVDEVEQALTAYASENEHRALLATVVAGNEKSVALANERYLNGLDVFLNVLTAQQQLYASQAALADSEAAVLTNLIALYKALGGGWEEQIDP